MNRKIKNILLCKRGQSTTEVVLLFPLLLVFILFLARIFGLLVLVQKLEIASFYGAKRWQQEAHASPEYANGWDMNFLKKDIEERTADYIGMNNQATVSLTGLQSFDLDINRTHPVWNILTFNVNSAPPRLGVLCRYNKQKICDNNRIRENCYKGYEYICEGGKNLKVVKYVAIRQRPVQFEIPVDKKKKR